MLRRFNYTDRKRIRRDDVSIVTRTAAGPAFDADLSLLTTYDFDRQCCVYVEAYRKTTWMRFNFGLVGAIAPPPDRSLGRFGVADGVQFRVKVTDPSSNHRLVAEADGIPLREADGSTVPTESLLRIVPAPLDAEVYRLEYDAQGPILEISRNAGDKSEIAKDPAFASLVYPAVFKDILTRILLVEEHDDMENLGLWQSLWLKFAGELRNVGPRPALDADDELEEWIRDAVTSFARSTDVLAKFARHWEAQQ